jgi:serine/threonine-protein kinase
MQEYKAGEVIAGKYRVERLLGEGGFSCVYLATQLGMDRPVALKLMKLPLQAQDDKATHEKLVRRFETEARVISQLSEPSTIVVYDYGETEGGDLYIALEYVRGRSLADELEQRGPLSPDRLAPILIQVARSLREAHVQGIIHRDIKPNNIMIYDHMGERDRVKVLDFGIAKVFASDQQPIDALTRAGMLVGTPSYMAPEFIRGEGVGPQADLYALGLTAYELLVGKQAVSGETPIAVLSRQIDPSSVSLPAELAVPDTLREVIDRMMAKDLSVRFVNAQEVIDALTPLTHKAHSPHTIDETPPVLPTTPAAAHTGQHSAQASQRIVALAVAGAILLVATIIGVGYWHNIQPTTPAAPREKQLKALDGLDKIAAELERSAMDKIATELERSTQDLKPAPVTAADMAPDLAAAPAESAPTLVERVSMGALSGADIRPAATANKKTVAKTARRVDPKGDQKSPPDVQPEAPQEPVEQPKPQEQPRPVKTWIEHIELR